MNLYAAVAVIFAVYLALVYRLCSFLRLSGANYWILLGSLALIGALGIAAFVWFRQRKSKPPAGGEAATQVGADSSEDLELLFKEADSRLAESQLGSSAKLGTLPVFFVMGTTGSTKTTTVVQSGLEPELLSGQVYQESNVAPTRLMNLWFARNTIFVEAAGKILDDPSRWDRVVRRLRPGRLKSVGKGAQAPRAALVCFDTENFLKAGGAETVIADARKLHARLNEISQRLGISFPVYALFTKLDRLAFFLDYVRNLSDEEASQVLGATLPPLAVDGKQIYTDAQRARLTDAFDDLYYSLCSKRTEFLFREYDQDKLPGVYEFAREFRKIRGPLVQFLVDLCRPSQLAAAPFLRGFYFTGVRPVVMTEAVAAPVQRTPDRSSMQGTSGATGMFRVGQPQAEAPRPAAPAQRESRRVPQWVFLKHLFTNVLLADGAALGASGSSAKVSAMRRGLLVAAGAFCLLLCVAFTVSWSGNRKLETQAKQAAQGISAPEQSAALNEPNVASRESLTRLENLRQSLQQLTTYQREGSPWSLRWGLYTGDDLYPEVRKLYFKKFHQALFGGTQAGLLARLKSLPAAPSAQNDYQTEYDTLKSYLITTSNHDKSTKLYLSPLLLARWAAGKDVGIERLALARKQFDFYSEELKYANPFSSENDSLAIERGRHYLSQFAGVERVYQFMLAEANKGNPSVNFNQTFPGSSEVVVDGREVAGAFTKSGWKTMQDNLKNVDRFFGGEQWVLGDQASAGIDRSKLEQQLQARYSSDFINAWRDYLKKAVVVRYSSIQDGAKKLSKTAGPQSPLMELFWLASQNTGVAAPELVKAFKPLHTVMPPALVDQYVGPSNDAYMKALATLQISLEQIAGQAGAPNEAAASQTIANAQNAKLVTRQMAQNFGLDPEAHLEATVEKLMEDPITNAEGLLRGLGPAELNGKGGGLCSQLSTALSKYPFDANASNQASVADVNSAFKPKEGALWIFYDANLQKILIRQGSQFGPDPSAAIHLNPAFINFFNRAAAFSDAAYAGGSTDPHLGYNLKPVLTEDVQSLKLTIDGQSADFTASSPAKHFTWQGSGPHGVQISGKYKGGSDFAYPSYDGLWAVFEWVADADARQGSTLEWKLKAGKKDRPVLNPVTGQPVIVRFDLDNPMLQKGYFAGLRCVQQIAKP